MAGLCFGDHILLEFLRNKPAPGRQRDGWGCLSADITRNGHVGMAKGGVQNPPQNIGECLWTVEPLHQHCAYRELQLHMTKVATAQQDFLRARKSSNALHLERISPSHELADDANEDVQTFRKRVEDLNHLTTQLKNALVQEIRFNEKLASRRKGDPIAFGQPVYLLLVAVVVVVDKILVYETR